VFGCHADLGMAEDPHDHPLVERRTSIAAVALNNMGHEYEHDMPPAVKKPTRR
jgi:hypothetical protein